MSSRFRRPKNFHPATDVRRTELARNEPAWLKSNEKKQGAKGAGIRWEAKVQSFLSQDPMYTPGPWLIFWTGTSGKPNWCQPDGLHFNFRLGILTIVEIKLKHTCVAWYQLRQLYQPVLAKLFPAPLWKHRVLELCQYFDPEERIPEPGKLIGGLHDEWRSEFAVWHLRRIPGGSQCSGSRPPRRRR